MPPRRKKNAPLKCNTARKFTVTHQKCYVGRGGTALEDVSIDSSNDIYCSILSNKCIICENM